MVSARDRVMQKVGERMGRSAQPRGRGDLPAQYGGQGEVLPLGAAGGIPIRGNIGSGGLAIGQPVSRAQGIVAGQPAAVQQTELLATAEELKALMAAIRRIVPQQVIDDVDPNGGTVFARQPFDSAWDKTRGVEFWYQPAEVGTDGEWIPKQQIRISASAPSGTGAHNGALWLQVPGSGVPSLFAWRLSTTSWEQIGGSGGPRIETFSPTTETGTAGDQWINSTIGRTWIYNGTVWVPQNRGFHGATVPVGAIEGDTWLYESGGYWYTATYTGTAWQKASYCSPPGCTNDPPNPPTPNPYVRISAAWAIDGGVCTEFLVDENVIYVEVDTGSEEAYATDTPNGDDRYELQIRGTYNSVPITPRVVASRSSGNGPYVICGQELTYYP